MKRYNHWFWHSSIVDTVETYAIKLAEYIWNKKYNR